MAYGNKDARVYATAEDMKVAVGARVYGDGQNKSNMSVLEAGANAGVYYNCYGAGVGAGAGAQVFNFKDDTSKTAFRAFGGDLNANAGIDAEAVFKKGHVLGGEVKARATLVEAKAGPFGIHLGGGISTAAKVEDGTIDARLGGVGVKVGKRLGVAVFDNEFSVETLSLVGKGWLWGDFD